MSSSQSIQFARAETSEQLPALQLVLTNLLPNAQAALVNSLAESKQLGMSPLEALVVAREADTIVGAAWAQPHVGKAASLWLPVTLAGRSDQPELVSGLLATINRAVDHAGIVVTQALLEDKTDPLAALLVEAAYQSLAELAYLYRDIDHSATLLAPTDLVFESYDEANHQRFKRVIQATYVDSLDCPDLEGRRDMEDVLAGYRATGTSEDTLWRLVHHKGKDLGVLLLAEHDDGQCELIYMGLVPEARKQGLGDALVAEARRIAITNGSNKLVVAVDSRNAPAKKVYESHGFTPWAKRQVYVRWHGELV